MLTYLVLPQMNKALVFSDAFIICLLLYAGFSKWGEVKSNNVIVVYSQSKNASQKEGNGKYQIDYIEEGLISHHSKITPARYRTNEWETSIPINNREVQIIRKTKRISFD